MLFYRTFDKIFNSFVITCKISITASQTLFKFHGYSITIIMKQKDKGDLNVLNYM